MNYPIPSCMETRELLRKYANYKRSSKRRARAQFEYLKSILERQQVSNS